MVSTYFKNLVADHVWHTSAETALPATYYLALSSTEPMEDGTGVTEPETASGYVRVPIVDLADAVDGAVNNTTVISWPELITDQGAASYWAIFDAPSGGHLLMGNSLSTKHLDAGMELKFNPGKLTLRVLGT